MIKSLLWNVTLASTLFNPALAAVQPPGPTDPVAVLDRGLTELLATSATVPFTQRYALILPIVDEAFDINDIVHAIVGSIWTSLSTANQQMLTVAFRRYTAASYVVNFSAGSGTTIRLQSGSQVVASATLVSTLITPSTGEPMKISYAVKPVSNAWRITDIYLDGTISQVAVQRSDFRSLLTSDNAELLIQRLNKKVGELSGGALTP